MEKSTLPNADQNMTKLDRLQMLIYRASGRRVFDQAKAILDSGVTADEYAWRGLLGSIGIEESCQRCCTQDHAQENIFYAYYEMIRRKMENRPYDDIGIWPDAIGMRIDACYACAGVFPTLPEMEAGRWIIVDRIVFCAGKRALIVEDGPNVYLSNRADALAPRYKKALAPYIPGCIGAELTDLSFAENGVLIDRTHCTQPVLTLKFSSGTTLRFSTNFGEVPDEATVTYFEVVPTSGRESAYEEAF